MNEQVDMSRFIEVKSDQLNADDLIGTTRTITVTRVTGSDGDQPVSIHYEGDKGKPFKPCKTIRRVLMAVWGRNGSEYVGKSMTLYRDDRVTFGGLETGGIRISHMSHMEKEMTIVVMAKKGKKAGVKILPLVQEQRQERAPRQTPQQWADAHLDAVDNAMTAGELDALEAKGKTKLAALPDLLAEVTHAYSVRRSALSIEGKPDDDTGEGFGDDE